MNKKTKNDFHYKAVPNNLKAFILLLLLPFMAAAQDDFIPESRRQEIESQKVAFITNKLRLTPEESQKFWPVYNEYQDKSKALKKELKQIVNPAKGDMTAVPDEELDDMIKGRFDNERQQLALEEQYFDRYKNVLPVRKVAALYRAEHDFKVELIKVLRDRRDRGR